MFIFLLVSQVLCIRFVLSVAAAMYAASVQVNQ